MALAKAPASPTNAVKAPTSDVPREILRDQWKRPLIVTPDGDVQSYTRASSLGGILEDQTGIGIWKMRLAAWAVAHSRQLRMRGAAIENTTDQANKDLLKGLTLDALDYAESKEAANVGTAIHAMADQSDRGQPLPDLDDDERPALDAYRAMISAFEVHAIETFVVCHQLGTAGTFDRLLSPRCPLYVPELDLTLAPTDRVIDDLKTSSTADYFGIKFCVQETVYALGTPYRGWIDREELERLGYDADMPLGEIQRLPLKVKKAITRGEYLPWPDGIAPRRDIGLIMHVPSGGSTARLHAVDLVLGLELARLAKTVHEWRSRKHLVVPMDLLGSAIAAATTREQCMELWRDNASSWTEAHTEAVKERLCEARNDR